MNDIILNKEEFKEFNELDQFGFFYDESGSEKEDADEYFDENIESLFKKYDHILVTYNEDIYGIKSGKKELIFSGATEAWDIAGEVKE